MAITFTQRGTVTNNATQTSFTLTPSSSATGPVMLVVGCDSSPLVQVLSTVSGGGTGITWTILADSSDWAAGTDLKRIFYVRGVGGTFDTSNITATFTGDVHHFHAQLIDCAGASSQVACHIERHDPNAPNGSTRTVYHQRPASANNRILASVAIGTGADPTVVGEGTELAETVLAGGFHIRTAASDAGGYGDFKEDVSWTGSFSSMYLACEIMDAGASAGATATRWALIAGGDAGDDIVTTAFTPSANSVVCFAAVGERVANSQDFTTVRDSQGSPKDYAKVSAINVDADHRLHLWAARYTSSPGSITITGDFPVVLTGAAYYVFELRDTQGTTDTDWGGTPVTGTTVAGTSLALSALSVGLNGAVLALWGKDSGTENFVVEPGYVPMNPSDDNGKGNETNNVFPTWLGGDEDNTASITAGATSDLAGIALEVLGIPVPPTPVQRVGPDRRAGN